MSTYAVIGAIVLVAAVGFTPALIRMSYELRGAAGGAGRWQDRAFGRYVGAGLFAWTFAWCKMRLDPMFGELRELAKTGGEIRAILDIGCGFGVAGCAALEWLPGASVVGVDPNPARVAVAKLAFGERGAAVFGGAPDFVLPEPAARFDLVLVLDVIHFISDEALEATLMRVRSGLTPGGRLILRAIVPASTGASFKWRFAALRRRASGAQVAHRPVGQVRAALVKAGFEVLRAEMSGGNPELFWFLAGAAPAAE
jgi:SAM-dependent methyltransferase